MIFPKSENTAYCQEDWLEKIQEQERTLRFTSFTRDDALQLGLLIRKSAREKHDADVAIKIKMNNITVFSYFMGKTGAEDACWMSRKYNTVQQTGISSLRALVERATGVKPFEKWCGQTMDYVLCGGAFPLYSKDDEMLGCVIVSALEHEKDHQLIVDALSEMLHVEVPVIDK